MLDKKSKRGDSIFMDKNQFIKALFELEYPALIRKAYALTTDKELAQDLVQDTFVLAFSHWETLAHHPSPGGWLTLTLFNLVRNEQRKLCRHNTVSLDEIKDFLASPPTASSQEILPKQLSDDDKQILIWRYELQLSYTEIARRLGTSENACRMRISRALKKCKYYLSKDDYK